MKTLFYTATAVFITLAAVIANFALQPPTSVGGARIVLDIDASGMPVVDKGNSAKASFDPYPGSDDEKPADTPDQTASPTPERTGNSAEVIPDDANNSSPDRLSAAPAQPEVGTPRSDDVLFPPTIATTTDPRQIPAPPPGTALAGLNQDRPLFREIRPDIQTAAGIGNQEADPAAPDQVVTVTGQEVLPSTNVAVPTLSPPETDAALQTQTALPAGVAEVRAPAAPPPPVPVRRPSEIRTVEEHVGTTGSSYAGAQFATAEVSNKPAAEVSNKPARIALLLRGIGRNDADAADAIDSLPSAVSLGFWPYATEGRRLASQAREKGHEIIIQLPLEPADYPTSNPGPDTLLTSLPPEQNAERLEDVLKRFEGHSGVTNLMGGKMLQAKAQMKPVLEDLKARGLLYVGESTRTHTTVRELAREINLRFGAADVLIDSRPSAEAVDKALSRLVTIARQRGSAIGVGNANAVTVQQVHAWSDTLAAQGITLVPIGALAQAPGSS
jgi:uncharacterized protein